MFVNRIVARVSPPQVMYFASSLLILCLHRHLRYLLKWAEELIAKQPSLAELQNQATTSVAVTDAIRAELTVVSTNQDLDHARTQEERDGRLNEK